MGTGRWTNPLWALIAVALAAAFLAACGGDANGADQFRDKTDSGLVDFGEEGSDSEREQAIETVDQFLAARSTGDWKAACEQIASPVARKFERLAVSSTRLGDTSCASFLEAFVELSPEELSERGVEEGVLRRSGRRGYLIYFGANEVVCAMPLEDEDGEWKIALVSAKRLS